MRAGHAEPGHLQPPHADSAGLPGGPAHQELLPGHRGQGQHEAGAGRGVLALPGPPVSAQHPQPQDVCNL